MTIFDKLDAMLKETEKATPGPWHSVSALPVYCVAGPNKYDITAAKGREYRTPFPNPVFGSLENDAKFIASARTQFPAALRALKIAVAKVEELSGFIHSERCGIECKYEECTKIELAEIEKEFEK